jgi:hypothetical protein
MLEKIDLMTNKNNVIIKIKMLQAAIALHFGLDCEKDQDLLQELTDFTLGYDVSEKTDEYLYNHFAPEMPYGTQKARDGDPIEWVVLRMENIFKIQLTEIQNEIG